MTGSCAHLCFASWMLCGVLTRLIDLPRVITLSWKALIAGSGFLTVKLLIRLPDPGMERSTGGFRHSL